MNTTNRISHLFLLILRAVERTRLLAKEEADDRLLDDIIVERKRLETIWK